MVDFAMDVFSSLYPDKVVPKELRDKRVAVVSELKSLQSSPIREGKTSSRISSKSSNRSHTHTRILSRNSSSVCTSLSTSTRRRRNCASVKSSSTTTSSWSPVSTTSSKTPDFSFSRHSAESISASQSTCWRRS